MGGRGANLVLVGVVHRDPRGLRRLARLLERERPDRVTVEVSRESVRFRREYWRRLSPHPPRPLPVPLPLGGERGTRFTALPYELRSVLRLPFEYRAARDYARKTGAPVALLEKSRYARERLAAIDEWMKDGSRSERRFTIADFDRELARARAVLRDPRRSLPRPAELALRDAFAAAKLRAWAAANPGAKVLHVGGWEHLVADSAGTSLY